MTLVFASALSPIDSSLVPQMNRYYLRQNYTYNPFSEKSRDMIRSMGNVEYFGMCEISPKIQCSHCLTHWTKGVELESATETWSQARRQNGRARCEVFDIENVYVCHPECRSSSWNGLLGGFTFYQKSVTTNSKKTIVRRDKEVDHRSK